MYAISLAEKDIPDIQMTNIRSKLITKFNR